MGDKKQFAAPRLIEYGRLSEIVASGNDGVPPPYPQGWFDGTTLIRTPECSGGDGPGKKANGPEAWWPCGSS